MLRDFVYLNSKLVGQFLAQLEGGVYEEETERSSQTGRGSLKGSVRSPIGKVGGERVREGTDEQERVLKQTPESQFNRLYEHLTDQELIRTDGIDQTDFVDGLVRGILLEVPDVTLDMGGFQKAAELAQQLTDLMPMMEVFGSDGGFDEQAKEGMKNFAAMLGGGATMPVIASIPGSVSVKVAMDLDRAYVLDKVEGEATLLVRVVRKLKKGESLLVGDPTGGLASKASDDSRRELLNAFDSEAAQAYGMRSPEIRYPAIVGTAVAIFR